MKISVVIPAAGSSSRMGQIKALLPAKNKTIIENQIDLLKASVLDDIFVVVNKQQPFEILNPYNVNVLVSSQPTESMIESVRCAMGRFPEKIDGMIVVPSDFPYLSKMLLNCLLSVFEKHPDKIAVPAFQGKRGHPVLISRKYFNSIMKDFGKNGIRGLYDAFPESVKMVKWGDDLILKNMNTKKDYEDYLSWVNQKTEI